MNNLVGVGVGCPGPVYTARGIRIGHITAQPDGAECFCGRNDCFESIATSPAISDASAEIGLGPSEAVCAAAAASKPKATAIINAITGLPKWPCGNFCIPVCPS